VRASRNITPIFRSAFNGPEDEFNTNLGVRPVVFDILAPDQETSILPDNLKMVLHVNPTSMNFTYEKSIERTQTKGGYVEQHWGDGARSISFSMVTGGFMRVRTGLSNITGGGIDKGGTRRDTIAYDKYLDMLALFHNNGSVYDVSGAIVFQGIIKVTFDGGIYFGWFNTFNVEEAAETPYLFNLTADFTIAREILRLRSFLTAQPGFYQPGADPPTQAASKAAPSPTAKTDAQPPTIPSVQGPPRDPENAFRPTNPTLQGQVLKSDGNTVAPDFNTGNENEFRAATAQIPTPSTPAVTNTTPELIYDSAGIRDPIEKTSTAWQTPSTASQDNLDSSSEGLLDEITREDFGLPPRTAGL